MTVAKGYVLFYKVGCAEPYAMRDWPLTAPFWLDMDDEYEVRVDDSPESTYSGLKDQNEE